MRKISSFILVILAGFFPYMPLSHAGESEKEIHCSGTHNHHEDDTPSDHSMKSCIEIIKKIHKDSSLEVRLLDQVLLLPSFEKYFETSPLVGDIIPSPIYHETDPPEIGIRFIGTVRIIS